MEIKSKPAMVQAAMSLSVFLVPFMGSSLNLALPQLADDFSMSALTLTLTISVYLASTAVFQMPAARLADLVGRRLVFLLGLVLFTAFTLASGLAWSSASLMFFRVLAGVGSAMMFGTNMAILTAVYPPSQRGKALGVNTAVVYAAVALGPVLGGVLSHHWGWRSIFFAGAFMGLAALAVSAVAIRDEWREARGESFDFAGAFLFAPALGGAIFGFSLLPAAYAYLLIALGAICSVVFVVAERRTAHPLIKLDILFGNRRFRLASLAAMINYSATYALAFMLSLYLQYVREFDARTSGLLLIVQPVAQTVISPLAGRHSDRVNPSILTSIGMFLVTLGLYLFSRITPDTPIAAVILLMILLGAGFGIFSSPNVNLIMGSVDRRHQSLASATTGTARLIGQSMSMAIATMAIHSHMGTQPITEKTRLLFMPSIRTAFLICAALCAIGVYASAAILRGDRASARK